MQQQRITGLDLARAIAIAGMALIHFGMVLSTNQMDSSWLAWLLERLSGRPATMFMLLAGIGVSLRPGGRGEMDRVGTARIALGKRGLFFLLVGFANLVVWPGDILRVYGVAYLIATLLIALADGWLLAAAASVVITFLGLLFVIDFETNWDFATLEYAHLWTVAGSLLNLFYNGFRAVFPWLGLMIFGMFIGRRNLTSRRVQRRLWWAGLSCVVLAEGVSAWLLSTVLPGATPTQAEELIVLLGTDSLPPLPLFLISSGGLGMLMIAGCLTLVDRLPVVVAQPAVSAGRMAFTWYMVHILVVIAAGELTGFRGDVPLAATFGVWVGFCVAMFLLSFVCLRWFRQGPLESVLRALT